MLSKLSIKNYALIKDLSIDFQSGFSVITGETGAGKSILLGAISLLLGQRADSSLLNNTNSKSVIEGWFNITGKLNLKPFFEANDLDYDDPIVLRREISESGKSRAFINDTPVSLTTLRELGLQLVDVHSQHSNLDLGKRQFQLNIIDWYGDLESKLEDYKTAYYELKKIQSQHKSLQEKASKEKADLDYFQFQYNQLNEAKLSENEQVELENELQLLTHSEEIKNGLTHVGQLFDNETFAILPALKESIQVLNKLKNHFHDAEAMVQRIDTAYVDLSDLAAEMDYKTERIEHNPVRLEWISQRLDLIFSLQQKHRVATVSELLQLEKELKQKIDQISSFDEELAELEQKMAKNQKIVENKAEELTKERKKHAPSIEKHVIDFLVQLGMPNTVFNIHFEPLTEFGPQGADSITFLFSANKGSRPEEISKVASGGEMSRLMLALKSVVAKAKTLPTIIFDEIDTGISGEIAGKMAKILQDMSTHLQVINITHLPQIASKGKHHYQVFKRDLNDRTETSMVVLNDEERLEEIAKMLSGDLVTPEALSNARALLGR
jgi:DNA repair protein RecN (Recombination protein N)